MPEQLVSRCADLAAAGFDAQKAADGVWQAMLEAEVFSEGDYLFASGLRATLKADAEKLYEHPKQLQVVMGHFATFPCVEDADVLLYVPDGMKQFIVKLGQEMGKPVAHTKRKPGSLSKYDFIFETDEDKTLALSARAPLIGEDVVTTLGSVAGLRTLLGPQQNVHSLAILLRGSVDPQYRKDLTAHYLLTRDIPTDKAEFQRRLREGYYL